MISFEQANVVCFNVVLMSVCFSSGRYEDQYIIRFYKDKLHSMPCQNQVQKKGWGGGTSHMIERVGLRVGNFELHVNP